MEQNFHHAFLAALNSPQRDLALLNSMLEESYALKPALFDTHREDSACEPINIDTIDWDRDYFALQSRSLEHNFSLQRARHLIALSQWLTEHQHDGFLTASASHNDNGNKNMTNNETRPFTPSQSLVTALESGSINRLRSALVAELENNRLDGQTVRQSMKWAESHVNGLFADYEESTLALGFEADKTKWDTDYYFLQSAYLNMNFARERFEHLMNIYQVLRDHAVSGFIHQPKAAQPHTHSLGTSAPRSQTPVTTTPARQSGSSAVRVAMLAGGAIAALALLIFALL
ncbi:MULTISPECIES: hypothetical protein [Yersinia]|uniref:hypothetical protein n=1 Tax=Yersinia TaxID=629 RepID=UPI001CFF122A|nr:hypothetical protein [Yersinia intermedia]ELX2276442.1 hypothetical protein [Yersinia enterocolitica]MCB5311492.1 hypothetical protein [Yersinia intermedia]MCB5325619.1 hypothetical protein [Yersinia intermedia]